MVRLATAFLIGLLLGPMPTAAAPTVGCSEVRATGDGFLTIVKDGKPWSYQVTSADPAWVVGRNNPHGTVTLWCRHCGEGYPIYWTSALLSPERPSDEPQDDRTDLASWVEFLINWQGRWIWRLSSVTPDGQPPQAVQIGPMSGHLFRYFVLRELSLPEDMHEMFPERLKSFLATRTDLADAAAATATDGCVRLTVGLVSFRDREPSRHTPEELLAKLTVTRTPG